MKDEELDRLIANVEYEPQQLKDYITNLQKENKRLKKDNKKKTSRCTERNHKIRFRDRKLERRNKKISKLEDYKSRCEKAIERLTLNGDIQEKDVIEVFANAIRDTRNILGGDE